MRYPRARQDVLTGANLHVDHGTTVAILGPSGSGKSTLLSVLGGLVRPTSGTVRVEGENGGAAHSVRDVTSWVLQTVNVLPERSALDNVAVGALTRGLDGAAARAEAATRLSAVGLGDRAGEKVRLLSGGELQRVVIARALATARPFVLADEPTGQLDRATSDTVLDALLSGTGGAGMVIVTHDPEVAERCDRTVRIENGAVVPA
ncbi:ABC transporter ATP-binding protein [Cellulomonas oligotrophica]|uniref:Lipoprotein-releasing system ATP-binding protein LolD n=1 Tax=Cellulomonas oligotrophica TaxID=931536 RepID=A0ABQ4DBS0_9CELL|nr:ATP-binding cassette domain-containing protein [Cellulomonas oligotrophica]GIG32747.1 lipoprotein-releasing system ATP-binding protein LolD [Cellulomonas oligotrophica]